MLKRLWCSEAEPKKVDNLYKKLGGKWKKYNKEENKKGKKSQEKKCYMLWVTELEIQV